MYIYNLSCPHTGQSIISFQGLPVFRSKMNVSLNTIEHFKLNDFEFKKAFISPENNKNIILIYLGYYMVKNFETDCENLSVDKER